MNDKFSMQADRSCGLIRIVMRGLLTLDDVHDFYEMRRRVHEELGLPKNAHLTLNDIREVKILPQETLSAFCEMLADPDYHSRRLAFIVAPTLVRAQVARAIARRDEARCFDDPAKAERWLLAERAPAMPLRRAVGRG
jgi:hypothetical protein